MDKSSFMESLLPSGQTSLPNPGKIFSDAVGLLGKRFAVSRAVIFTIQKGRVGAKATYEFCAPGVSSILGKLLLWDEADIQDLFTSVTPLYFDEHTPVIDNLKVPPDWQVDALLVSPIRLSDTIIALFCLQHCNKPHHWSTREVERFAAAVDKISNALEIIRPVAELYKYLNKYTLINELVRQLTPITNLSDLFHTLVIELRKAVPVDFVTLNLIDETTGRLNNIEQARYSNGRFTFGYFLPANYYISGWCVANWRSLFIPNLAKETIMRVRREWLDSGLVSCASFPLIFNDHMLGAVLFFTSTKVGFDDFDLKILQQANDQLAAGIHRIHWMERLGKGEEVDQQLKQREDLIKRISKSITSQIDSDLILQNAVNELGRYLSASRCAIILANQHDDNVEAMFEYCANGISSLVGVHFPIKYNPILKGALKLGEPAMYTDAQTEVVLKPLEDFLNRHSIRSTLYHIVDTQPERIAFISIDQCDRIRTWTKDEQRLLAAVGQELAIALEQANMIAKLQSQAEREALLNRITAAIRASLEPKEIFEATVAELGKTLNLDHCFIGLTNANSNQMNIESEYASEGSQLLLGRFISQSIFQELWEQFKADKVIFFDEALLKERLIPLNIYKSNEINTLPLALYVPVHIGSRLIAVIGLCRTNTQAKWRKSELSFVASVADQVAVAISQAQLLEQTRAQADRETLLNEIFKTLAESLNQTEVMNGLVLKLGEALKADRCIISLYDKEGIVWLGQGSEYLAPGIRSVKDRHISLDKSVLDWLDRQRQPLVLNNVNDYPFEEGKMAMIEVESLVILPIIQLGKLIGTLDLHQCVNPRRWKESEIDILKAVVAQVAVAINNTYLFEAIANGQKHWQRTFDSMTDGVALVNSLGRVICANETLLRLCQVDSWAHLIDRLGRELFAMPTDHYQDFDPISEALQSGVSMQIELHDIHHRILRQNIDPIIDERGRVSELILVVRDVTKERLAEEEMAQRNRELSVLNSISEEITKSLEIDQIIVGAFTKTVEIMGADTGWVLLIDETQEVLRPVAYHGEQPEVVATMFAKMNTRPELITWASDFKEAIAVADLSHTEEKINKVFIEIAKRLGLRSVLIASLQSKDHTLGLLIVANRQKHRFKEHEQQLITAIGRQVGVAMENARLVTSLQEALQQLREANRHKDEFLATLSHELRTPLTAILGWTEILAERDNNDAEMVAGLGAVLNNAQVLQKLINDLLELSRIENRVLKLELEPTNLNLVIMSAIQTVKQVADNRQITIEQHLAPTLPPLNVDSNRLQQVFWNLFTNSIKFSRTGGHIQITTSSQDKKSVEVKIEDNGIGIESDFLPLVFERFRQADSSSTRRYGGLGIGLSLVKLLVEMHGGEVQAHSLGRDQGSTFIVRLPINPTTNALDSTLATEVPALVEPIQPQVLIIEDLEDNLRLLTAIIERQGYRVLTARNTDAGLRMAERYLPKLILIDINMPGRSPYDVLQTIRNNPRLLATPVFAVTSFLLANEQRKILANGFTGLLTKPFRRSELLAILNNLMSSNSEPNKNVSDKT